MPENTTARDPLLHLIGMEADGQSAYITGMEADGQRQLVNSTDLPTESGGDDAYVALGFTFGEPHKHDPLFRPATLPEGWKREGSDHAMWSYIVDGLGRKRVAIFYKAAFYDRRAFMRLETVSSYAWAVLHGDVKLPVFDDAWCTREAFVEALKGVRRERAERVELYEKSTVAWVADELPKARAELAEADDAIQRYS